MSSCHELQQAIEGLLGTKSSPRVPNVGQANQLLRVAETALATDEPCLYNYLTERGCLLPLAQAMAGSGWHGPAHALLYLYYDQIVKQERASGQRIHKGPVLCDLANLHQLIGSRASCHHYAALSVVADVLREPEEAALRDGGLAFSMLLQYEQRSEVERWRSDLRTQFNNIDVKKPIFAEAGLAARWFPGRAQPIYDLSVVPASGYAHFGDLLIDQVSNKPPSGNEGVLFEAAIGLLLSATPGFEVRGAFKEPDEQVDLLVQRRPEPRDILGVLHGYGLVECRATSDPVGAAELRDFGAKCFMHDATFGLLASLKGITGEKDKITAARLTRRKFFHQGITLLVVNLTDLREARSQIDVLGKALRNDYERLAFGDLGQASKV